MKTLDDWYRNNLLTDVTLVCDDRFRIECHRMVLCASSPLLGDFITITGQRQEDAMRQVNKPDNILVNSYDCGDCEYIVRSKTPDFSQQK